MITLTDKDNNTTVTAAKGDTIDIVLPSNPSTGFLWQSQENTAGHLDRVQQDAVSSRPGSPGSVRFRFVVTGSGQVTLFYARPWEELTPPARWFTVNIEATD